MDNSQMTENDRLLWKQAKSRVSFKRHLFVYIVVNGFIWALWALGHVTSQITIEDGNEVAGMHHRHFPGPIFMTLGWGIGLTLHFYGAYVNNKHTAVQKEFEKLKNSNK